MTINSNANLLRRPSPEALEVALAQLAARFGNRFSANASVRAAHAHTLSWTAPQPPDAVVFPNTTEEVAEAVKICAMHKIPIIPYGTGTSLEGHVNAPLGGLCIDLSHMNAVVAIHAQDLTCTVEPGVTRKKLNENLRDVGLFFPIDPGADASLGGMAATRASGTNAVRYGTMKDNVLALEVVLPNGEIIKTGSRAKKSSAGYDLTRLFVGSEGTLGLITQITLKLHGIPEAISAGICPFPTVRAACEATIATIQSGLNVARIELLDALQVKSVNAYSKLNLPEMPLLMVEFHGSAMSVAEDARRFGEIADDFDGGPFQWATAPEERSTLWAARHDVYWATLGLRPGTKSLATDVCVPISRLADCVEETQADIAKTKLVAPIVGHVGDGNFHVGVLVDTDNPEEMKAVEGFIERLVLRALAMDGTCTGEHGIGQAKRKYMLREHGGGALNVMASLKTAIDPHNIMNPGKIL